MSSNFEFLQEHDPIFYQIGTAAERAFAGDPNTTLLKLRQLAEALAQNIATRIGIEFDETVTQETLLYKLKNKIGLDQSIQNIFLFSTLVVFFHLVFSRAQDSRF